MRANFKSVMRPISALALAFAALSGGTASATYECHYVRDCYDDCYTDLNGQDVCNQICNYRWECEGYEFEVYDCVAGDPNPECDDSGDEEPPFIF